METKENMYEQQEYENPIEIETVEKPKRRCPRSVFVTIIFLSLVISVPILLFYFITDNSKNYLRNYDYTCLVGDNYKVSCGGSNTSFLECMTSSCCYNFTSNACYHYLPSKYFYKPLNSAFTSSQNVTPFLNKTLSDINFSVDFVDKNKLQIHLNSQSITSTNNYTEDKTYFTKGFADRLGVEVYRSDTNDLLLTTLKGPLIVSNGYWEWNVYLKNDNLFGFGEVILEKNRTISKVIYKNKNDHNTLPIFMAYLNGLFHGVYIESDGPLEVTVLPSQLIKLKSLSGNRIVLNVCTGPTPKDVRNQQQHQLYKPINLPYWSLGAHVCRDGTNTSIDSAIEEYKKFEEDNKKIIKFSSDCIHESLYSLLEADKNPELEKAIKSLQEKSRFVMSVSPQILKKNSVLYDKALSLKVNYMDKDRKPYEGVYLDGKVIYPDFNHDDIKSWFTEFKKQIPTVKFDGFVLKDNWPTDDSYTFRNEEYHFPYITKDINTTISNTIPWNAITANDNVQHITKHNQYGASQVQAYINNFPSAFIITSSYDYGISQVAQIQNVNISWVNLKKAISTTLYHSIFGNPFITIPVCGSTEKFNKKIDELLCIRWYLAAVTFPIFRISSDFPRRDPLSLPSKFAFQLTSNAIKQRFKLLPYYHTILSNSEPLVRPLFYDYYMDNETLNLDEQYMLGNALLVAHPVIEPSYRLRLYLPPIVETWYEFWGGQKSNSTGWVQITIVETDWIMYIAAGHIVPYRNIKSQIIGDHNNNIDTFGVAIALKCEKKDILCSATGTLKFDKATLNFEADDKQLTISNIQEVKNDIGCDTEGKWPRLLEMATIYGKADLLTRSTFDSINLCTLQTKDHKILYFK